MTTTDIIQRLIEKADYYDTFGETFDGQICREAAAALAESLNAKAISRLQHQILKGN